MEELIAAPPKPSTYTTKHFMWQSLQVLHRPNQPAQNWSRSRSARTQKVHKCSLPNSTGTVVL